MSDEPLLFGREQSGTSTSRFSATSSFKRSKGRRESCFGQSWPMETPASTPHLDEEDFWTRVDQFQSFLGIATSGTASGELNGLCESPFHFKYKGRAVTGCPVHFAVFLQSEIDRIAFHENGRAMILEHYGFDEVGLDSSAPSDYSNIRSWIRDHFPVQGFPELYPVASVLERGADALATATIPSGHGKCELDAIHLAAGLGCITALEALVEKQEMLSPTQSFALGSSFAIDLAAPGMSEALHESKSEFRRSKTTAGITTPLNRYCYFVSQNGDRSKFYTPLHDATYCGKPEAVHWLLAQRADPNVPNKDGKTLMHHLASQGEQPFMGTVFRGMNASDTLEWLVKRLLEANINLQATTAKAISPLAHSGRTALELSALPGSQFPRSMMYLLAPSCQHNAENTSIFNDIALISNNNVTSAEKLAEYISSAVEFHTSVRLQAQEENAVDLMANLLYTSPKAAVHILRILTVQPIVQDPGHNPLSKRASLASTFGGVRTMKCTYQQDVTHFQTNAVQGNVACKLRWPVYKCNQEDKDFQGSPWHKTFAPPLSTDSGRRNDLYDTTVDVVLLPNLMDVDILWALTCTWQHHLEIFETKVIRAIIGCLWDNLVADSFLLMWVLSIAELCALLTWALSRDANEQNSSNSSTDMPLCYAILSASVIKELFFAAWWLHQHRLKASGFHMKNEDRRNLTTLQFQSMWSVRSFFNYTQVERMIASALLMTCFLACCNLQSRYQTLDTCAEIILASNVLYRFFKIGAASRVFPGLGPSYIAIGNSVWGSRIQAMLAVTIFYFLAFFFSFITLARNHNYDYMWVNAYRALIFADGTGFDNLHLQPDNDVADLQDDTWDSSKYDLHAHHYAMCLFMLLATVVMNVVLLNLIIAVFSSEYEMWEPKSVLMYEQERAKYCCKLLMIVPNIAEAIERRFYSRYSIYVLAFLCFVSGLSWLRLVLPHAPEFVHFIPIPSLSFAIGQIILIIAWMRSDWFPPDEHLAFSSNFDTKREVQEDFFLWICSRADYIEDFISQGDDIPQRIDELQDRMSTRIDDVSNQLHDRLHRLERQMDTRLDRLLDLVENLSRPHGHDPRNARQSASFASGQSI